MKNIKQYMTDNKRIGYFGNSYLDYKLKGINKGDLILIGSRTGAGKSTIAEFIATYNAHKGVKVTLISLENFEGDNILNKAYYYYKLITGNSELHIRDFMCGEFDIDEDALAQAENYAKDCYKNINLITRPPQGFTQEDLKECLTDAKVNKNSELVIIDHLDYFDKLYRETDNEHITKLMNEIREAQYALKIPIVAISHLRKNGDRECIIPSIDEFIGSSNKAKQATIVIVFAPDDKLNEERAGTWDNKLKSTFCCVRKLRHGGCDNTVGRLEYDTRKGEYSDFWAEHKINYYGTKISENPINTSKQEEEYA